MPVVLWIRNGEAESADAQILLKRHGYRPEAIHDIAARPPTDKEWLAILGGLPAGASIVARDHPELPNAPSDRADLAHWLAADAARAKAPILLTPRGAIAGFRERQWSAFLGLGPLRGG